MKKSTFTAKISNLTSKERLIALSRGLFNLVQEATSAGRSVDAFFRDEVTTITTINPINGSVEISSIECTNVSSDFQIGQFDEFIQSNTLICSKLVLQSTAIDTKAPIITVEYNMVPQQRSGNRKIYTSDYLSTSSLVNDRIVCELSVNGNEFELGPESFITMSVAADTEILLFLELSSGN